MIIAPSAIDQAGPGINLSNQPEGLSVQMSEPVQDLAYARNAVTLTFDLSSHEHVRLSFKAPEYGGEPLATPSDRSFGHRARGGLYAHFPRTRCT